MNEKTQPTTNTRKRAVAKQTKQGVNKKIFYNFFNHFPTRENVQKFFMEAMYASM